MSNVSDELAKVAQALTLLMEAIDTNTESINKLYALATEEPDGENPLQATLEKILLSLDAGTKAQIVTNTMLGDLADELPKSIQNAVVRGINIAVKNSDEDGVVKDD